MGFRSRLLLAFAIVVALEAAVLAVGIRREMADRLTEQYQSRVNDLAVQIEEDLRREGEIIAAKLEALESTLTHDNDFRTAVAGFAQQQPYLQAYASQAMRLTGLALLQIQDEEGTILSSGHFRQEYRLPAPPPEPQLPEILAQSASPFVLVEARTPQGPFLALARAVTFRLGSRPLALLGGTRIDEDFLNRLVGGRSGPSGSQGELAVSLHYPGGSLSSRRESHPEARSTGSAPADVARELTVPFATAHDPGEGRLADARFRVTHSLARLEELRRSVDTWFFVAAASTFVLAFLLSVWLGSRLSRPLRELAKKTAEVDLDRLDVDFKSRRRDEIGALSRLLEALTQRLRASALRLRESERRATVGDLARQVNHDIKNGLAPIRNIFRHFGQVVREHPGELPEVFGERRQTLDSSIEYLETLAGHYARLSSRQDTRPCQVNTLIDHVVANAQGEGLVDLRTRLAGGLPPVLGDPVALRRILENLIKNAVDSLEGRPGSVTVSSEAVSNGDGPPAVRITVADTGRGMTVEESEQVFNDFYTTKEDGTGLGLSIVRRLTMDLGGTVRVISEPGKGSRFLLDLPAAGVETVAGGLR